MSDLSLESRLCHCQILSIIAKVFFIVVHLYLTFVDRTTLVEQLKLNFLQDFVRLDEKVEEEHLQNLHQRCFSTDLIAAAPKKEETVTEHDLIGIYWRCFQYLCTFQTETISQNSRDMLINCIRTFYFLFYLIHCGPDEGDAIENLKEGLRILNSDEYTILKATVGHLKRQALSATLLQPSLIEQNMEALSLQQYVFSEPHFLVSTI